MPAFRMVKQSSRRRRAEPAGYGFLTVGRTARLLGVGASTLRLWESVGLVSRGRSNGRYRLYSPDVLKVLKRIKYLRDVQRLNVPGIKRELGGAIKPRPRREQRPLGPLLRRMRQRRRMPAHHRRLVRAGERPLLPGPPPARLEPLSH